MIRLKRLEAVRAVGGRGADTRNPKLRREATMEQATAIDNRQESPHRRTFVRAPIDPQATAALRSPRARSIISDLVRQLSDAGFAAVVTKDTRYAGVATADDHQHII